MTRHRYRQEALSLEGATPRDYNPQGLQLAGPRQGWLALDGGALGPLFNTDTTYHPNTDEHHHDDDTARTDRRG